MAETSGPLCVFNNGWRSLGGPASIFMSRVFPADTSKVSQAVPSNTLGDLDFASCRYALSLARTQVCLANYSSSPPGMASDIWCYVNSWLLCLWRAPAEQSSLRDNTLFLLFNLCSPLFFAGNVAEGHALLSVYCCEMKNIVSLSCQHFWESVVCFSAKTVNYLISSRLKLCDSWSLALRNSPPTLHMKFSYWVALWEM